VLQFVIVVVMPLVVLGTQGNESITGRIVPEAERLPISCSMHASKAHLAINDDVSFARDDLVNGFYIDGGKHRYSELRIHRDESTRLDNRINWRRADFNGTSGGYGVHNLYPHADISQDGGTLTEVLDLEMHGWRDAAPAPGPITVLYQSLEFRLENVANLIRMQEGSLKLFLLVNGPFGSFGGMARGIGSPAGEDQGQNYGGKSSDPQVGLEASPPNGVLARLGLSALLAQIGCLVVLGALTIGCVIAGIGDWLLYDRWRRGSALLLLGLCGLGTVIGLSAAYAG